MAVFFQKTNFRRGKFFKLSIFVYKERFVEYVHINGFQTTVKFVKNSCDKQKQNQNKKHNYDIVYQHKKAFEQINKTFK